MITTLFFDKLLNWIAIALVISIILSAELVGGGTFFAETGLIHAVVLVFVALIVLRIFSKYAFEDYMLKGFLKIQMVFLLFLGLTHVYEYVGLNVIPFNDPVVEFSVTIFYLVWIIGNVLALEFICRIYKKRTYIITVLLYLLMAVAIVGAIFLHIFHGAVEYMPMWVPVLVLGAVVVLGIVGIVQIFRLNNIMPIFNIFSLYAVPAVVFVVFAAFSEYSEATGFLGNYGVSDTQGLYLSHFTIYIALALLFVAFGKLKRPDGIYKEI